MNKKIEEAFEKLALDGGSLPYSFDHLSSNEEQRDATYVAVKWQTSAESLLQNVFGSSSSTYMAFKDSVKSEEIPTSERFSRATAVFASAKEQFENGLLFNVQTLAQADVFDEELDQAAHFLSCGYQVAAAVTAGVVLETSLKKLCELQDPPIGLKKPNGKAKATDTLISNLKNSHLFNEAIAKQLRAWMNVRNDAAHGTRSNGEFENREIQRMIEGIRDLIIKHVS